MPDAPGRIAFRFEGRVVSASPGQSLAAALTAAGELTLGTGRDGSPRGAFCGMGVCHDCLVVVDGRAGQRACMTGARDGLDVERQPLRPDLADPRLRPLAEPAARPDRACDLLVVGAGPAGLAAAVAARSAGAAVLLADERPSPGGQYYKQPATADERARADRQARRGAALVARARTLGVAILGGTAVWGAERRPDGTLAVAVLAEGETQTVLPRAVVVATGAYERAPILPGWTLPGVMTSGALQTMLRADGAVPPGRILVAGNGPLNIQVAVEALRRGARVVGVVEAASAPGSGSAAGLALLRADPRLAAAGVAALARLRAAGVPVHWGHRVVGVAGEGRAERARIAPVAGGGAGLEVPVEVVALGEGFAPADELSRLLGCRHAPDGRGGLRVARDADGRTSLPDIFVAGEAGRFGGARVAEVEGTLAGRAAARGLGFAVAGGEAALRRALARHERFQAALWRLFDAPHPALVRADDATILCRCEALTLGTLRAAVRRHAVADLPTLKRLTRAGMGRCQGRYCAPALGVLLSEAVPGDERGGFAPQMPLRPVPLAALAGERAEWDGHRRSLLPAWTHGASLHEAPREAEVAIVGAGIAGLSTALFLARAGCDALVIERSAPNALASGGNAGSLHAQLLSFDHGARAAGAGGPAARTLPLQRDSIALWAELQRELGADFEMAVTGGLMVAETERDLDFLRAKTSVERAQGVDSEVIDAAALRALEPALSDLFLGAALCPAEGKINPLVATQAILAAAEAAGARVLRRAAVTGLARDDHGFRVQTSRGPVRARRIVNAAGAFASTVARMLGADLPVHGAPLQMIVTEPAAPTLKRLVAHADRHLTLKQASNGAFIIGGGWTAGLDPVHGHPRPLLSSLAGNLWVAQRVVPRLDRLHVVRSWAAMNIDIDGAPILGEDPRVPGLFHAVTSNGYTLGPLVGRLTADLVTRGTTDRDLRAFSVARFSDAAAR